MENQNLYPIVPPLDIKIPTAPPDPHTPPPPYEQSLPIQSQINSPQIQPLDAAAMNAPQIIIQQPSFGTETQIVYCPNCGESRRTRIEYASGLRTHLIALVLCFTALWPCACAPYCCCANDICQYPTHYCESCGNYLGTTKGSCPI